MFRKARLIILYIASNGGIQEAEMKKLLSVSGLPQEFLDCFRNLPRLGISMGKPVEKPKKKKGASPPQAKYDVSRFQHPIQKILLVTPVSC